VRLAAVLAATALSYPLGLTVGNPWLLPALNTLPAYLAMVQRLRAGDRRGAVVTVLAWAATLAICGTLSFALWPQDPARAVLNGPGYREEMFTWICTGVGREGNWRSFLPQHLLHLVAFVALSLATASAISILFGAVLMNYMAYYVASLLRAGVPTATVVLFGWQPWALCRVAAFCTLGAILAEPLLKRLRPGADAVVGSRRVYLAAAAAGILADWILKATLAPTWGRMLRGLLCP
jgi:hypothetical protein